VKDKHIDQEEDAKDLEYRPRNNVFDKMNHDICKILSLHLPEPLFGAGNMFELTLCGLLLQMTRDCGRIYPWPSRWWADNLRMKSLLP
jgi:hypothetical protein